MSETEIIRQILQGEVSNVQFKERIIDSYDIGCELVAFSNARGGALVVGVRDKTGSLNPLTYQEGGTGNNQSARQHCVRECCAIYSH